MSRNVQQFFQAPVVKVDGERINLSLLNSENTSVLDSIRQEEHVIRVEKQLGGMSKTWYTIFTTLSRDAVDAYAAYLKQKYSLENCMRFIPTHEAAAVIPVDENTQTTSSRTSRSAMWQWGDAIEMSVEVIRQFEEKRARGPQPGKMLPVLKIEPPSPQ